MINWPINQPTLSFTLKDGRAAALRPLREEDIEPIYQACQDPTISAFTRVPYPYDRELAEDFVRGSDIAYRNHQGMVFAIEVQGGAGEGAASAGEGAASDGALNSEPRFAGTIGLHGIQLSDHCAEVGYWVEKSHRGAGLCTEAVKTLLNFSFTILSFRRIEGLADYNNLASQLVMERAGMSKDALLRNRVTKPNGDQIDMVLFSALASK